VNRHQADLNGLAGGSSVAMIGGISAVLVAPVFLVSACPHWRFCVRHPVALPVRYQSLRFTFARPNPVPAMALVSAEASVLAEGKMNDKNQEMKR